MKTIQAVEMKKSCENRNEALVNKIKEIAESDQFDRIDIERCLAEKQNGVPGRETGRVICDLLNDSVALELTASLLYNKFKLNELVNMIDKTKRRLKNKNEELNFHVWDRYRLDDGSHFHLDHDRMCIVEGIGPGKRKAMKEMLDVATKIFNCSNEQLSVFNNHLEELNPFEKDLIELLTGPECEDVKATWAKLLRMNSNQLKQFEQIEKRPPIHAIAQILIELKR